MYSTIRVEFRGPVAIITLNRPEQLNTYTVPMGEDLVAAFGQIRADSDLRVVILTGAGRAFCAGVDLVALKEPPDEAATDRPALGQERFVQDFAYDLYTFPKPVIAAINGAAIGVGLTMTLPCDIRLAAAGARLGMPFARLGIVPALGSTFLLPRLVGSGQARILALGGQTIAAEDALAMGLVDRVFPAEFVLDEALVLASTIAGHPPGIIALIKEALNAGVTASSIAEAMAFEHAQNARRRPAGAG